MSTNSSTHLVSGRLLARNTIWNLLGQGLPLVVAAVAIPVLIREIGVDRFGVLSVAWMLIGYFSLFDFGIDQGLTKIVADRLGSDNHGAIPVLVWTSLAILLLLGIVSGISLALLSPLIVNRILKIPVALHRESLYAFYLLAVGMPIAIVTSGIRGVLEAMQRFGALTAIRVPMGASTFLAPLLVLPFSKSLVPIIVALLLARIAGLLAHFVVTFRAMPDLRRHISFNYREARPVLHFGSWVTVSNLVSPIMANMDRFFIGSILSIGAVTYYTAPFDMVTKLFLLVGALGSVLFPALTISHLSDRNRMVLLLNRGLKYVFLSVFPLILIAIAFAPEGLHLWLGGNFADESSLALRLLSVGVLVNSLSLLVSLLIQAAGRPDVTAKFHLMELPIYCGLVWWLIRSHGINGAALAWSVRIALDAVLLGLASISMLPETRKSLLQSGATLIGAMLILLVASSIAGLSGRIIFVLAVLAIFSVAAWFVFLAPEERALVRVPVSLISKN